MNQYNISVTDSQGVVIGDHNVVYQTILSHYPELTDDARDFRAFVEKATRGFVGRDDAFAKLAEFRDCQPCGYFRIVAEAGLGKTALAAEISRRYRAPVFFVGAGGGANTTADCLRHLSVELIARFKLAHTHLPARAGHDSAFLVELLREALEVAGGPVWLVIDALDEATEMRRGSNPLLLPDELPHGVYVVLTQRPTDARLATQAGTPVYDYRITGDDPAQQFDVETYLRQRLTALPTDTLRGADSETLLLGLKSSSQGNFMYLTYILADLEDRQTGSTGTDVSTLPQGLQGYYDRFWALMSSTHPSHDWDAWDGLFRPVIERLGVAAEPVTSAWLSDHVGRSAIEIRERVLLPWQRVLSRRVVDNEEHWFLVHRSFGDFLAEVLDLRTVNARVAEYYQAQPARWTAHNRYAARHLSSHLRRGGQRDLLFALVDDREWYKAQLDADSSGATYVEDVAEAWAEAEDVDNRAVMEGRACSLLGQELRCALVTATANSLRRNLPSELVDGLLEYGIRRPEQMLAEAHANPDELERVLALSQLLKHLEGPARTSVIDDALLRARSVEDPHERARAQLALLAELARLEDKAHADALRTDTLATIEEIPEATRRAWALAMLSLQLPEPSRSERLREAARIVEVSTDGCQTEPPAERRLWRAMIAEAIDQDMAGSAAQATLLAQLSPDEHILVLAELISAARRTRSEFSTDAIAALAAYLGSTGDIGHALGLARAIPVEKRARPLARIARYVRPGQARSLVDEALEATHAIGDDLERACALSVLAEVLRRAGEPREARAAMAIARSYGWSWRMRDLAPTAEALLPWAVDGLALRYGLGQGTWRRVARRLATAFVLPGVRLGLRVWKWLVPVILIEIIGRSTMTSDAAVGYLVLPFLLPVLFLVLAGAPTWGSGVVTLVAQVLRGPAGGGVRGFDVGNPLFIRVFQGFPGAAVLALGGLVVVQSQLWLLAPMFMVAAVLTTAAMSWLWTNLADDGIAQLVRRTWSGKDHVQDVLDVLERGPVPSVSNPQAQVDYQRWRDDAHRMAMNARATMLRRLPAYWPTLVTLGGASVLAETSETIRDIGERWP